MAALVALKKALAVPALPGLTTMSMTLEAPLSRSPRSQTSSPPATSPHVSGVAATNSAPVGSLTAIFAVFALSGPRFLTVALYVSSLPTDVGSGESVTVTSRSATATVISRFQHTSMPVSALLESSTILSVQSPSAGLPSKALSGLSGWKEPANGDVPELMAVVASSSRRVSVVGLVQSAPVPRLSPSSPLSLLTWTVTPSCVSHRSRSESRAWSMRRWRLTSVIFAFSNPGPRSTSESSFSRDEPDDSGMTRLRTPLETTDGAAETVPAAASTATAAPATRSLMSVRLMQPRLSA